MIRKTVKSLWTSAVALAVSATPVLADETINLKKGSANTPVANLVDLTLSDVVSGLIRVLVIAAAVVFFIWLVLGGIKWIMSGGDKAKTEEARNQITAALIGLVIVFSAWAIAQLINTLFSVNLFDLKVTPLK